MLAKGTANKAPPLFPNFTPISRSEDALLRGVFTTSSSGSVFSFSHHYNKKNQPNQQKQERPKPQNPGGPF
jgi:hypothetical protein